ncbi:heme/hemin ABC transporter substrate-binding protein [Microbacterium sp. Clip185]|uniref:heme/hemin ABC transporter substrate-binding protein n=1 Tax=Microbacterium sp. Clip185 TaxID=3025663 RepID=UPI0023653C90|nr:ABC transporter substrate-binding protein [Microbacterium sp. Clip185]WDG17943.1 ABC transporter substrate-binding protein [Microbacterium sp. Clip185]
MRRRAIVVALGITAALLTGCASPTPTPAVSAAASPARPLTDLETLSDPRAYEGASTAVLPHAAIDPVDESPTQTLPATVLSHDLQGASEVTVSDTSRVVAMDLSGSLAATVWGLGFGGTLVGRDVSTTFPGVEDLPVVTTGGHTVSSEAVIALRPTLVITDGSIGPRDVVEQLRDVGIPVVFVANESSFAGAQQLARDVAAVFGAQASGEALAERIGAEVERVRADIAAVAPAAEGDRLRMVFLYLRGTAGVYYLFGEESGADEIIRALGGVDVAGELGWDGMRPLTDEAMVAANPDLILVMTGGLDSVGGVDGLLTAKPAIAITAAGAHRRFVDMEDGQILSFGPRSAEVLEALARAVYAPAAS